jgi:hypothetical protein
LFLPLLKNPRIAALAGVDYTLLYAKGEDGRVREPPVTGPAWVSIVPARVPSLPRVFLVRNYRVLPQEEIIRAMQSSEFDPAGEVILEHSPAGFEKVPELSSGNGATIVSRKPNRVVVDTESVVPAILILTDSYYPGWEAKVDGGKADILRANYVFRAVPLSGGRHRIVFEFRPKSFFYGSLLTMVGIIIAFLWGLVIIRSKRNVSGE